LKRRNAIEPIIAHLKNDGLLGRNYLKGELGDAMRAILCAAGHNIRLILRQLRIFGLGECYGVSWKLKWLAIFCNQPDKNCFSTSRFFRDND
jgi:hypothetical protein